MGAQTKAKFEELMDLAARDPAGFQRMFESDPAVFPLQEGLVVVVVDSDGLLSGLAQVRPLGGLAPFWTVREAFMD